MIRRRRTAAVTGAATMAAVIAPLLEHLRPTPRDSFPLSHYPMFTTARSDVLEVTHLIGRTVTGERVGLPCSLLGPGGMNQHRKQLRRAARRPARSERLVASAAKRVAKRPRFVEVAEVELVTCGYRVADWFTRACPPSGEVVHARAAVARPGVRSLARRA